MIIAYSSLILSWCDAKLFSKALTEALLRLITAHLR